MRVSLTLQDLCPQSHTLELFHLAQTFLGPHSAFGSLEKPSTRTDTQSLHATPQVFGKFTELMQVQCPGGVQYFFLRASLQKHQRDGPTEPSEGPQ